MWGGVRAAKRLLGTPAAVLGPAAGMVVAAESHRAQCEEAQSEVS